MLGLGIILLILIITLLLVYFEDYANSANKRVGLLTKFMQKKKGEQRKTLRLTANLNVKYHTLDDKNASKISQSHDISVGGAQIVIYEKLNKDTKVELEIELPYQPGLVRAIGEVVWLKERFSFSLKQKRRVFFAGLKFIKISPHDEAKLLEYIYASLS